MTKIWTVYRHISSSGKVYNYCKAVEQLDDNLNIIKTFRSAIDAAKFYSKSKSAASKITECCRGTRNKTLNSKWRYKYGK